MKFSQNWLQSFFAKPLPAVEELAEAITFHSSEIEELAPLPNDAMLDAKVLPDRSAWLMSHRGLAKEISVIIGQPLKADPFLVSAPKFDHGDRIKLVRESAVCDYYAAVLIEGVKVGPSPEWLKAALQTIGQRSINNIVDATNYVMFELGQPLHAFDADKLGKSDDNSYVISVRQSKPGENITSLSGDEYGLSLAETVIVDGTSDTPIGIAGIKGGQQAAIDSETKSIILESAHFDRVAIRKSAKRLKLPTDAAKRFENGISVRVAPLAMARAVELICSVAGGVAVAAKESGETTVVRPPVTVTLTRINSVLGLTLSKDDVTSIIDRFGYQVAWTEDMITVTPSFERDDIVIPEDLIEEIGRVHGLHHIASVAPKVSPVTEFNVRHYYAELIRTKLTALGFSEICTSSFRDLDIVKLENSLATDKGYLRSTLVTNMREARERNIQHRDLLGLFAIKIFEIGTVFNEDTEEFRVALSVQTGTNYKAKHDEPLLAEAIKELEDIFGINIDWLTNADGVIEFSLDSLLSVCKLPTDYLPVEQKEMTPKYQSFSLYPSLARDIALWVPEGTLPEGVQKVLTEAAGTLLVRTTLFDEFDKDGRTSLAFRLVFQANDRTLTEADAEAEMAAVNLAAKEAGFVVR